MWVVAKVKIKKLNTFKKDLDDKMCSKVKFYHPKIQYHKFFGDKIKKYEKSILDNYIFCYHDEFKDSKNVNNLKFLKGLEYFLEGCKQNQNQILKFISYCKSFENDKGFLTQSFFANMVMKKAKFISGPFTNIIFEIIEKQKNKLKILIGNIVTTIPSKTNCLYHPIK
jgi:hypothetical protein